MKKIIEKLEVKKRGMQKGFLSYENYKTVIVKCISENSTTKNVMISLNSKMPIGVKLSWNTIQKYLELLEQEGKVRHQILGGNKRQIHIWNKVK